MNIRVICVISLLLLASIAFGQDFKVQLPPGCRWVTTCSTNGICLAVAQTTCDATKVKPPKKDHNFFDWKNDAIFASQAGGAVVASKEWNGVLSYYIPDFNEWRSQLHQSYKSNFAIVVAVDGIGYGFHKARFPHHHLIERLVMISGSGLLYWNAVRNKHNYDKTDCDKGREEGNQFLISHFCH
ncbi:MAG TPA: hypothetical protein VGQ12_00555 [Candidatus Angelobacter sp.]|jgi:hypothetical protein|nr:hypothetical protein [Candidatus Angelobacter sp.]